jgi:hypothetical protein
MVIGRNSETDNQIFKIFPELAVLSRSCYIEVIGQKMLFSLETGTKDFK